MALEISVSELKPLPTNFFDFDVDSVARDLIGTFLFIFDAENNHTGGMIVETEAYDQCDLAAHCYVDSGGEPPESSKPMLFPAGHAYLYYANSLLCLNFVCDRKGFGSAVLIRALKPTNSSIPKMKERRKIYGPRNLTEYNLCNGPGVLCEALGVCDSYYKRSLTKLSLFERPFDLRQRLEGDEPVIIRAPRYGIKKQMHRKYPQRNMDNDPEVRFAIERKRRWGIKGSRFLSKPFPDFELAS